MCSRSGTEHDRAGCIYVYGPLCLALLMCYCILLYFIYKCVILGIRGVQSITRLNNQISDVAVDLEVNPSVHSSPVKDLTKLSSCSL